MTDQIHPYVYLIECGERLSDRFASPCERASLSIALDKARDAYKALEGVQGAYATAARAMTRTLSRREPAPESWSLSTFPSYCQMRVAMANWRQSWAALQAARAAFDASCEDHRSALRAFVA